MCYLALTILSSTFPDGCFPLTREVQPVEFVEEEGECVWLDLCDLYRDI